MMITSDLNASIHRVSIFIISVYTCVFNEKCNHKYAWSKVHIFMASLLFIPVCESIFQSLFIQNFDIFKLPESTG